MTLLYGLTIIFKRSLESATIQMPRGLAFLPKIAEHVTYFAEITLSMLQVLLFLLCHTWSGNMIDKNFWNDIFQRGQAGEILIAIVYIGALCSLGWILPRCVPDFAAVMSLPPFFNEGNQKITQLVAMQVVDQKMVNARAQMGNESK